MGRDGVAKTPLRRPSKGSVAEQDAAVTKRPMIEVHPVAESELSQKATPIRPDH